MGPWGYMLGLNYDPISLKITCPECGPLMVKRGTPDHSEETSKWHDCTRPSCVSGRWEWPSFTTLPPEEQGNGRMETLRHGRNIPNFELGEDVNRRC